MKKLYIVVMLLTLTSCANYKFGDISATILDTYIAYCSEENAEMKDALLQTIKANDPDYKQRIHCGNLDK